jgi:hypothetical protein
MGSANWHYRSVSVLPARPFRNGTSRAIQQSMTEGLRS